MTVPIYPAAQKNKKVSQPPQANEGPPPHLFRDPRHGRALEPGARVPLDAERRLEAARVLRRARVRVRQVPHRVLGRLLVAPLGDDDVRLAVVRARGGRDAREPLELVRVRRALAGAVAAPGALRAVKGGGGQLCVRERRTKGGGRAFPAGERRVDGLGRVRLDLAALHLCELLCAG